MQTRRFSDISVISAILVLILGFSVSPALAQTSTCEDNGTVEVCVEWSSGVAPAEGTNYKIEYHGGAGADVQLWTGDLEWRLWTTLVSDGSVTDFGDITLNPTVPSDDFEVSIKNGTSHGAEDVESIVLDAGGFTGYSNLGETSINGNVWGAITLIEDSGGAGGEITGAVLIDGFLVGPLTVPKVSADVLITGYYGDGFANNDIDIGVIANDALFRIVYNIISDLDSALAINIDRLGDTGTSTSGSFQVDQSIAYPTTTVTISAMPTITGKVSEFNILGSLSGVLDLKDGVPDENVVRVGNLFVYGGFSIGGEIKLNTMDIAGSLLLGGAGPGTSVRNGGAVSGTVTLGSHPDLTFSGTADFSSVSASGTVQTHSAIDFDGQLTIGQPTITGVMDGEINFSGNFGSSETTTALIAISGAVKGDITIGGAVVNSADVTLSTGLAGGSLIIVGDVLEGSSTFTIADMISDGANHSLVDFQQDFGGTLNISPLLTNSGIQANQEVRIGGEFISNGTIDLNNRTMAGLLYLEDGGSGSIVNGGPVDGIVYLADGASDSFSGSATFDSVTAGTIQTLNGGNLSGALTITNNVAQECVITGAVSGTISIGGNLSAGGLHIDGDCSGDLVIDGDLIGVIVIGGDLTGDVSIDGNMTGRVTIEGALAAAGLTGAGRILVGGLCDGRIMIHDETNALSLIHLLEGLDDNGSIEINVDRGNYNAAGDIQIGPSDPPHPLNDIIFDGCIHIYDNNAVPPDYGALDGDITVVGCHETGADLDICIDGDVNGTITITNDGCDPNLTDWSCPPGGCP